MTLTDTGPLIALVNRNDPYHRSCIAVVRGLSGPLVTTWPCLVEAMHIVYRRGGRPARQKVWSLWDSGGLLFHAPTDAETDRMAELMDACRDRPMDLADASLVAAAEALGVRELFTLDGDFRIDRLADGSALDLLPRPGT